jgi:phosphotransferase system enzyme I (PtsP)
MRADFESVLREAGTASDLDELLAIIVRRVEDALPVDGCAVCLTDAASDQLVGVSSSGAGTALPVPPHLAGLISVVVEREELVVLPGEAATGHDAFLGMPLIHDHRILGVLAAWKTTGSFGRDEVPFFVTIAAPLAAIIDEHAAADEVASLLDGGIQETAHLQGVMAAGGLAVGTAALIDPLATLESVPDRRADDVVSEEKVFRAAVAAAQAEVRTSSERLAGVIPSEVRKIFDVYVMLLGSDELVRETVGRIRAGNWAPGALRDTIADHVRAFDRTDDPYLRARGEDIRQIGQRILVHLHSQIQSERSYPEQCILVGDTISITEIAAVPVSQLAGIVCRHGSALSHMACWRAPWEFRRS